MHPRDLMVTQEQRYERFVQDADQWRLAKLAKMGRGPRPNWTRTTWAWLRHLVVRRAPVQKEDSRSGELVLGQATK